ncbi:30S ribosomal protein S2, partial [Pseudomonas sp. NPDC087814]
DDAIRAIQLNMGSMDDDVIRGRKHVAGGTEQFVEEAPVAAAE